MDFIFNANAVIHIEAENEKEAVTRLNRVIGARFIQIELFNLSRSFEAERQSKLTPEERRAMIKELMQGYKENAG